MLDQIAITTYENFSAIQLWTVKGFAVILMLKLHTAPPSNKGETMARLARPTWLSLLLCCSFLVLSVEGAKLKTVPVSIRADSEHANYEAYRAMDGDPATMWHTEFGRRDLPGPHHITFDLGKEFELKGFVYTPRKGGGNGTIGRYECYVGNDLKKLGKPILTGEFAKGSKEYTVTFDSPIKGRYVRLRALSEVNGRPWASIAELRLVVDGVNFRAKGGPIELVHEDGTPFTELEVQYVSLSADLRNRAHFDRVASETYHPASLVYDTDRDPVDVVLRRTAALVADLKTMA